MHAPTTPLTATSASVLTPAASALPTHAGDEGAPSKLWSAEDVQQLTKSRPSLTPWTVVRWQAWAGLVAVVLAGCAERLAGLASAGQLVWLVSAAWGAMCAVLPSAAMAWGLRRRAASDQQAAALARFFLWEAVKIVMSLALLVLAPKMVTALDWLVMVLAFVLVTKAGFWGLIAQANNRRKV